MLPTTLMYFVGKMTLWHVSDGCEQPQGCLEIRSHANPPRVRGEIRYAVGGVLGQGIRQSLNETGDSGCT